MVTDAGRYWVIAQDTARQNELPTALPSKAGGTSNIHLRAYIGWVLVPSGTIGVARFSMNAR